MASKIETSFGSRLANAQKLASHLEEFTNYNPVAPEFSLTAYQQLITTIFGDNSQLAGVSAHFSKMADDRQQLFSHSPEGMMKRLPYISAFVKALYGKKSVEAEMIASKINKIRGVKTSRLKKNQEGEFVSQSQASYGSMIQNYSNLIDTLISFGATYTPPAGSKIEIGTLQALMTQLNNRTEEVNQAYGTLKMAQDKRQGQYELLHNRSMRIKETVKALYGIESAEYKLIKGLKI